MIFNNKKDIKQEIKSKVYRFYDDKIHDCSSYKVIYDDLIPLLNNYLYELKILKEIITFDIKINKEDLILTLSLVLNKETITYDLNVGINQYKKDSRTNKLNMIDNEKI